MAKGTRARVNSARPGRGHARRVSHALKGALAVLATASTIDGVGAGGRSGGSAGRRHDDGRVGEAPVRTDGGGWKR